MILQTIKLSKKFAGLAALTDVDLTVKAGEVFGIAGPNGAGKSTLFNVIAGSYPVSSGKVLFGDQDITKLKSHQISHLGLGRTFQICTTFPTLNVYDNLRVGATFGPGRKQYTPVILKEKIEDVMEFLKLTDVRDQLATNLDIYSTKMVMLGSVLATDCKAILLDEPLAGLSISEITSFMELIRKINQEMNITVIMIEHLLDMLIDISNRMAILHNGKVIYLGSPEGIREDENVVDVYLGKEE